MFAKIELLIKLIRKKKKIFFLTSSNSFDPFGLDSFLFITIALSNGLITTDSKPLISPRQNGHNGGGFVLFWFLEKKDLQNNNT